MATEARAGSPGNDRLLFGMILGVLAFCSHLMCVARVHVTFHTITNAR